MHFDDQTHHNDIILVSSKRIKRTAGLNGYGFAVIKPAVETNQNLG
jgi:hypothetical protein